MGSELTLPSPVTRLDAALLRARNITLDIKRDDLIHPILQGNKWRKLKYNLQAAKQLHQQTLLTFGGAFSNHIHATAAAGHCFGFRTIGVIRGEPQPQMNPTLLDASNWGMQLHYVSRADYRHKQAPDFIDSLHDRLGDFYLIPEGGNNALALPGCREIVEELDETYDVICAAAGTGATLAGIISACPGNTRVLGFPVLKNAGFLYESIRQHLHAWPEIKQDNWRLQLDYHFGAYARTSRELMTFITDFKQQFGIDLDPVYTGKLFFGVFDLIRQDYFRPGSKILLIHSGGLQGVRGFGLSLNDEQIFSESE